jgi:hypothetical protein
VAFIESHVFASIGRPTFRDHFLAATAKKLQSVFRVEQHRGLDGTEFFTIVERLRLGPSRPKIAGELQMHAITVIFGTRRT